MIAVRIANEGMEVDVVADDTDILILHIGGRAYIYYLGQRKHRRAYKCREYVT